MTEGHRHSRTGTRTAAASNDSKQQRLAQDTRNLYTRKYSPPTRSHGISSLETSQHARQITNAVGGKLQKRKSNSETINKAGARFVIVIAAAFRPQSLDL